MIRYLFGFAASEYAEIKFKPCFKLNFIAYKLMYIGAWQEFKLAKILQIKDRVEKE